MNTIVYLLLTFMHIAPSARSNTTGFVHTSYEVIPEEAACIRKRAKMARAYRRMRGVTWTVVCLPAPQPLPAGYREENNLILGAPTKPKADPPLRMKRNTYN